MLFYNVFINICFLYGRNEALAVQKQELQPFVYMLFVEKHILDGVNRHLHIYICLGKIYVLNYFKKRQ